MKLKDLQVEVLHNAKLAPVRAAAESISGHIDWAKPARGALVCPLGHPATVFVDGLPTFFCHHERCREDIADWNREQGHDCRAGKIIATANIYDISWPDLDC